MSSLNNMFTIGEGLEKFSFLLMCFLMICHFMACIWVFTADLSVDSQESGESNWILDGEFETSTIELYTTAIYFTVTTITTVGYGDIGGSNQIERGICMFLMIMGVIFFSVSSGTLTNIISSYEEVSNKQ